MIGDTVSITEKGADVLTKFGKAVTDISYSMNEDDDEEADDSDDEDRKLAKKIARDEEAASSGGKRSGCLAQSAQSTSRTQKAEELEAYRSTKIFNVLPNQVKVDMANQCVILPICGNPVPFHISTIKNVSLPDLPDPDSASYLRINFYTAGVDMGKDCPENTVKLVQKYAPYATFIQEMTFRSLDSHSLTTVCKLLTRTCPFYLSNNHISFHCYSCLGRHFVKYLS